MPTPDHGGPGQSPRHAADRQTAVPATRGAGIATAFPATWPAAAPRASLQTQPAPSMRPETPPPAPVGPLWRPARRPPMPAHL